MTNRPTFALLREKRELQVRNPENGARFTISLRDWQAMLWAVRVHPEPQWRQPGNAYTTAPKDRRLAGGTVPRLSGSLAPAQTFAAALTQVKARSVNSRHSPNEKQTNERTSP